MIERERERERERDRERERERESDLMQPNDASATALSLMDIIQLKQHHRNDNFVKWIPFRN